MTITIRTAIPADVPAMLTHFPRLAAFELPAKREPHHFYQTDQKELKKWAAGEVDLLVQLAEDEQGTLMGFTMTRMGKEFLSYEPSAHLEVLIVTPEAEGKGVARKLIEGAETNAQAHGAKSMSLHVIATNVRARGLYQHLGYYEEVIRNIKHF